MSAVLQPQKIKSEKKPQARGFNPHAMAQAQVLNQQPDSIPAMMKPGEYVLPPDTVAAMGGPQALDATVAQTHTPTNAGAIVPKGFEPRLFFSSGGLAQEEETKQVPTAAPATPAPASAQTPRAQFVADQNAKLAAANARLAERTQEMNARYQTAPNSPTNTFPANRLPVDSGAASVQQEVTPPPDAAQVASDREAFKSFGSGFAGGVDNLARAAGDVLGLPVRGLAGAADTALVRPARAMGLNVPYMSPHLVPPGVNPSSMTPFMDAKRLGETAPNVETSTAAPERTPEQLAKQLGGLDRQHAQNVQLQSAARTPEQARAEVQQTEGLAQVRGLPGVYQHGKGQYSDNPEGMGFATGFTGQPSAKNMQAANALASQQQAQSMGRVAAQQQAQQQAMQPRGFAAPQIDHSGNSSASKDELRRLRWAAESAIANAPRKKYAMQHPAVMAYQAALQGDTAARYGGQAELEAKTNDTNASLQREQMQQQGANQRDAGRLAIDQQRLGLDAQQQQEQSTARGFEIRGAQRKEAAQSAWEKASPEQRSVMKEMYPDLFGDGEKKKSYSFDVVRGSADPVTGKREGDYAVVFDPNTGRYRQVQIGQ